MSAFGCNRTEESDGGNVEVVVRVRPLVAIEFGSTSCIDVIPVSRSNYDNEPLNNKKDDIFPHALRIQGHEFHFDKVLGAETSQGKCYAACVKPLVTSCLMGYNATVLSYGQTGSGKTHTILGGRKCDEGGVIPRALDDIFSSLDLLKVHTNTLAEAETYEYKVHIQFIELYGEEIRDLLVKPGISSNHPKQKLFIQDGRGETVEPRVIGASEKCILSSNDGMEFIRAGMKRRVTASTNMNAQSSRSHAIFTVVIQQISSKLVVDNADHSSKPGNDKNSITVEVKKSRFHFVDLAGSERAKRSQAEGKRLQEGININKGLLVLGNVISALGDEAKKGSFIPYRDSKLTRILKGSLGGNHKTLMIACASPSLTNSDESLNCLRYANRAKNIKNKAVKNVEANTTKVVQELKIQVKTMSEEILTGKSHVKAMAEELLQIQYEKSPEKERSRMTSSFSVKELKSLAGYSDKEPPVFVKSDNPVAIEVNAHANSTIDGSFNDGRECAPTRNTHTAISINATTAVPISEKTSNLSSSYETYLVEESTKDISENKKIGDSMVIHDMISVMAKEHKVLQGERTISNHGGICKEYDVKEDLETSNEVMDKLYQFERKVALLKLTLRRDSDQCGKDDTAREKELTSTLNGMSIDNDKTLNAADKSNTLLKAVSIDDPPLFYDDDGGGSPLFDDDLEESNLGPRRSLDSYLIHDYLNVSSRGASLSASRTNKEMIDEKSSNVEKKSGKNPSWFGIFRINPSDGSKTESSSVKIKRSVQKGWNIGMYKHSHKRRNVDEQLKHISSATCIERTKEDSFKQHLLWHLHPQGRL